MRKILFYVLVPTVCMLVLYFVVGRCGFSFLITSVGNSVSSETSDLFSAYASMFGALVTVFVALFAFEKWMDRKGYEVLKSKLEEMENKQAQFVQDLEKKIDDKIPNRIREYINKNEGEILEPITQMITNQHAFVSVMYVVEFLESSFDSFASFLSGKEKSRFFRSLFNELVRRLRACGTDSGFEYFEKSINLLLKMSMEFEREDFIVEDDREFAQNMDYVWFLIKRIQFLESARNTLKIQHPNYENLERSIEKNYRKYVSYPQPQYPNHVPRERIEK